MVGAPIGSPQMPSQPGTPATPGPTPPAVLPQQAQAAMPTLPFNLPTPGGMAARPFNPGVSSIGAPVSNVLTPQQIAFINAIRSGGMAGMNPVAQAATNMGGGAGGVGGVTPPSPLISVAQNIRRLPTPMLQNLVNAPQGPQGPFGPQA